MYYYECVVDSDELVSSLCPWKACGILPVYIHYVASSLCPEFFWVDVLPIYFHTVASSLCP